MSTDPDNNISPRYDDKRQSDAHSLLSSRQNLFDRLPTETIGEIFSYSCPILDLSARKLQYNDEHDASYLDPSTLLMVCKRWHAIALSNRSLWAKITLTTTNIYKKDWLRSGFSLLCNIIEKSGAYPLNIHICCGAMDRFLASSLIDIIMPHSERWRSIALDFSLGSEVLRKLNTLIGRLPLLEHLELEISDYRYTEDMPECRAFLSAPRLKSICIFPYEEMDILRKIGIPKTQISEVTLRGSEFEDEEELQKILGWLSVSLTSLTFSEVFESESWPKPQERKIILPQLRQLRLFEDGIFALYTLTCPLLEELEIFSGHENTITKFLDRSSCSLTHFKVCGSQSKYAPMTYQTVLDHSSLSTLRSISLAAITDLGLDLLNFDSHRLYPSLETLHLYLRITRRRDLGPQQLLYYIEKIQKVIDSRTHAMSSNTPGYSLVHGPQATEVQWGLVSSLKKCCFHFDLELDGPVIDAYWDEGSITALQSFCISRKIFISLKISYWWNITTYNARSEYDEMEERVEGGTEIMEWDLNFP